MVILNEIYDDWRKQFKKDYGVSYSQYLLNYASHPIKNCKVKLRAGKRYFNHPQGGFCKYSNRPLLQKLKGEEYKKEFGIK